VLPADSLDTPDQPIGLEFHQSRGDDVLGKWQSAQDLTLGYRHLRPLQTVEDQARHVRVPANDGVACGRVRHSAVEGWYPPRLGAIHRPHLDQRGQTLSRQIDEKTCEGRRDTGTRVSHDHLRRTEALPSVYQPILMMNSDGWTR
jgi:hypothetical protein